MDCVFCIAAVKKGGITRKPVYKSLKKYCGKCVVLVTLVCAKRSCRLILLAKRTLACGVFESDSDVVLNFNGGCICACGDWVNDLRIAPCLFPISIRLAVTIPSLASSN